MFNLDDCLDLGETVEGNLSETEGFEYFQERDNEFERDVIDSLTDQVATDEEVFLEGHLFPWLDD